VAGPGRSRLTAGQRLDSQAPPAPGDPDRQSPERFPPRGAVASARPAARWARTRGLVSDRQGELVERGRDGARLVGTTIAPEVGRHWAGLARRCFRHLAIIWGISSRRNSKNARVSSRWTPAGVSGPTALIPSCRSCSQRAIIWSRRVTASYQVSLEMR